MNDIVAKLRGNAWLAVSHAHLKAVAESSLEGAKAIEELREEVHSLREQLCYWKARVSIAEQLLREIHPSTSRATSIIDAFLADREATDE